MDQELSHVTRRCQKLFFGGAAELAEEGDELGAVRGGREAVDRSGHGFFVAV